MKVKITIPESFADITIGKYVEMIDAWEGHEETHRKVKAAVSVLCNMNETDLDRMSVDSYNQVSKALVHFMSAPNDKRHPQSIVELNGVRYGLIPNWNKLSLGEFADLEYYATKGFFKCLNEVMSVIYRPIVEEAKGWYTIEPYDQNEKKKEQMLEMPMDVAINAMVFFYSIAMKLLNDLESSSTNTLKEKTLAQKENKS